MPPSEPVFLGLNEGTWFAVIALLLTMVVSILATVLGYRSAGKDRESRIVLSHMDRETAREAREQARRLTAYADLATFLDRMVEWTLRTAPTATFKPAPPMPQEPDREELRRQLATVRLVGSPSVRTQLAGMWDTNTAFQLAVSLWQSIGERLSHTSEESLAAWHDIEVKRRAVVDAATGLEAQMRADLGMAESPTVTALAQSEGQ